MFQILRLLPSVLKVVKRGWFGHIKRNILPKRLLDKTMKTQDNIERHNYKRPNENENHLCRSRSNRKRQKTIVIGD